MYIIYLIQMGKKQRVIFFCPMLKIYIGLVQRCITVGVHH